MIHGILIERQNAQDDDSSEHDSEDEVALEDDDAEDGDEVQVLNKSFKIFFFFNSEIKLFLNAGRQISYTCAIKSILFVYSFLRLAASKLSRMSSLILRSETIIPFRSSSCRASCPSSKGSC